MWGDNAHKREMVPSLNVCDKAFKSLKTPNQHIIWQYSDHVFFCNGCGKKFQTNNSTNRHIKLFGFKPHHRKSFCNFSMWGKGGREEKEGSVQLQEEGRHPLPSQLKIYYLIFNTKKLCNVYLKVLFKVLC